MTTEQKIAAIVEDCCAVDPSFHGREAELRPLIKRLLESRPDTRFDESFAKKLRDEVLALAADRAKAGKPSFWERFRHLKRDDVLVLGGAALGLVLATTLAVTSMSTVSKGGGAVQIASVPRSTSFDAAATRPAGTAVTPLAAGAFGSLSLASAPIGESDGMQGDALATGRGGGGTAAPVARPLAAEGKVAMMPIDYQPVNYRYVYKGDIKAPDKNIDVYRRVKGFAGGMAPLAALGKSAIGTVDLTRLDSASLQNFTLTENREFGYMVTVDANEGIVSFGQDWRKWPHPESQCQDDACFQRNRLTAEQMPSDEASIGVADRFLQDYGISRETYGAPEVRGEWRAEYAAATDKASVFLPDSVIVVYPLVIDGKVVDDADGVPTGLMISVNVRHMRVDGMWGLNAGAYERSSYAAETDVKRLRAFVEQGGIWGAWNGDPSAKTVDVELGDPEVVLALTWKSREDGTNDDLYETALRFPVLKPPPDQAWFRRAVVVPLVKEALDAAAQPGAAPAPTPGIMTK